MKHDSPYAWVPEFLTLIKELSTEELNTLAELFLQEAKLRASQIQPMPTQIKPEGEKPKTSDSRAYYAWYYQKTKRKFVCREQKEKCETQKRTRSRRKTWNRKNWTKSYGCTRCG